MGTVTARIELDDYSNRVISTIKAKYGLKDKSEAIKKFVELYGDSVVEREVSDEYVKKIINIVNNHLKNKRKMSLKELDNLCEV